MISLARLQRAVYDAGHSMRFYPRRQVGWLVIFRGNGTWFAPGELV